MQLRSAFCSDYQMAWMLVGPMPFVREGVARWLSYRNDPKSASTGASVSVPQPRDQG